jgi:peptidoglycan hydrolase-like protein with peptidoglycan-binding domain
MKTHHLIVAAASCLALVSAYAQQADSLQSDPVQQREALGQGPSTRTSTLVKQAQQKLKQHGFDVGEADGTWGPKTEQALKAFQQQHGIEATGNIDQKTMSALSEQQDAGGRQSQAAQTHGGPQDSTSDAGTGGADSGTSSPR